MVLCIDFELICFNAVDVLNGDELKLLVKYSINYVTGFEKGALKGFLVSSIGSNQKIIKLQKHLY